MSEHVYRITEIVGSSESGIKEAIENAVAAAGKGSGQVEWFEMSSLRGHIAQGKIAHFQVALRLGVREGK